MKITAALVAQLVGDDITALRTLNLSKKGIDSIDDLSSCVELRKLDLSHNELEEVDGLADNR